MLYYIYRSYEQYLYNWIYQKATYTVYHYCAEEFNGGDRINLKKRFFRIIFLSIIPIYFVLYFFVFTYDCTRMCYLVPKEEFSPMDWFYEKDIFYNGSTVINEWELEEAYDVYANLQDITSKDEITYMYITYSSNKLKRFEEPEKMTLFQFIMRKDKNAYITTPFKTFYNEQNFSDVELLKNLQFVEFSGYSFDLSTLPVLSSLSGIKLCHGIDLNTIQHLNTIRLLSLEHMELRDITPISKFNNLEYLNLNWNEILDLTLLENFEKLIYLDLGYNFIINQYAPNVYLDYALLQKLPNLRQLKVSHIGAIEQDAEKQVSDIGKLIRLEKLALGTNNNYIDLNLLTDLNNLEEFAVSGNISLDFRPLNKLEKLESIHIIINGGAIYDDFSNQPNIYELNHIKEMFLYIEIGNIPNDIEKMENLESLYINSSNADISNLYKLPKLKNLAISYMNPEQLPNLYKIQHLENLRTIQYSISKTEEETETITFEEIQKNMPNTFVDYFNYGRIK